MNEGLHFDLRLEERKADSVVVSLLLDPRSGPVTLDGVSLQVTGPRGVAVSAQMLLPISGTLQQPMLSTLELRPLDDEIPQGSRVVAVAWGPEGQHEATIPTDPFTELELHMRARRVANPGADGRTLERLSRAQRAVLAVDFPWIDEPRVVRHVGQLEVVDHEPEEDEAFDGMVEDLGIDAESAEWLKDLLDEDE